MKWLSILEYASYNFAVLRQISLLSGQFYEQCIFIIIQRNFLSKHDQISKFYNKSSFLLHSRHVILGVHGNLPVHENLSLRHTTLASTCSTLFKKCFVNFPFSIKQNTKLLWFIRSLIWALHLTRKSWSN